ncbi:MAG: hypothetical protein ABIG44_00495 [Planctomycetota bacterium]
MKQAPPKRVTEAPPHSLCLVPTESAVEMYVREDEFIAARYPAQCTCEYQLPVWDEEGVMCMAFLLRLAGTNAGTFDSWINVAEPGGLRLAQLLSTQSNINTYLVTDRITRSFRHRNPLKGKAAGVVATIRTRVMWSADQFEALRQRLDQLYTSSAALWRGARDIEK